LAETLRYKTEGRGFYSQCSHYRSVSTLLDR